MNPFILQGLYTVLLPAVVSGVLYLIFRLFLPKLAPVIAVAFGFTAAQIAIFAIPRFPPTQIRDYLPLLAFGSIAWSLLEPLWYKQLVVRWVIRAVLLLGLEYLFFQRIMQNRWETWEAILWFSLTMLVLLFVWHWLETAITTRDADSTRDTDSTRDAESNRPSFPALFSLIALIVLTTGSSVMLGFSSNASAAQQGGTLASALGAIMVLSIFLNVQLGAGLATLYTLLQGGLWISGAAFASVPILSALLMPAGALVLYVLGSRLTAKPDVGDYLTRLAVFIIPIALAAGFAYWQSLLRYGEY
ncbi:MAG: hypothetical protein ACRCYY_18970 [Trueperaceae bacterium]